MAIRLDVADESVAAKATLDVRILPLISATDYSEIESIVGATRAQVSGSTRACTATTSPASFFVQPMHSMTWPAFSRTLLPGYSRW